MTESDPPHAFEYPSTPPGPHPPQPGAFANWQPPYPPHQPGMPYQPGMAYPPPPYLDAYGQPLSDKSKLTAGLLQLFLGGFGVGRFYLGYTGIGVAQIVVTLVTCGIGGIWPLVDAIMMLAGSVRDAQGRTLRD